jgi:hypothetical protein
MRLEDYAAGAEPITIPTIGGDRALATQLQLRLGEIGLLDPPADGSFGPVSHWALAAMLRNLGMSNKKVLDAELAQALLGAAAANAFPINPSGTLAGRIVRAMEDRRHWVCRHPDAINIVYVEGMDADGAPNVDAPNEFNDLRVMLRVNRSGNPEIMETWDATTEPGRYYTLIEKLDPRGAARIAFGQYKSWSVGTHMAGRPSAHEALVQTADITVYRDLNQDFERVGDLQFTGLFGVNQHWGFDLPKADIGRASAGCLVGRTKGGHQRFMSLCKSDPRFQANNSYRFMTTVLPAEAVRQ